MKLTLITIGSRGDVQPFVALGKGLLAAGYAVRFVTLSSFESFVRSHGLEFWPVEGDAQELVLDLMVAQGANTNPLKMYRGVMRSFGAMAEQYIEAFAAHELRDSDAILCQLPGALFGFDLAEALGIPYIALASIPQEPTGAYPYAVLPVRSSLGPWWNKRSYDLAAQLAWRPFRRSVNRFRNMLGSPAASFWWGNTRKKVPVLQGFSEHVVASEPEWGKHVHTTGYWILDEPDWTPSAELVHFLAEGEAPLYVGFGSMPVPDPRLTTRMILDVVAAIGQRVILSGSWVRPGAQGLPEQAFNLDYAPHGWLFPNTLGLVHHGGGGTTGAALRSGVPSVVVPFTADQPFWGERSRALGVGPGPIPFHKLTARKLAKAFDQLLADESMRESAAQLRDKMAREDGVGNAVDILQQILNKAKK